ncbi:MAG: BlaI/MecI/CopY family transcriptional regulator [Planctomycetes bacterium]|nr:BlaI/MecI/CopY family transcriptional regulator [Planctomycetota bacterium]
MRKKPPFDLGRRERQIMDVVYRLGQATVADVLAELPDPPSYSSVRAMLGLLERKGYLRHKRLKLQYVYFPTISREKARKSALDHLLRTFFDGSPAQAVAALLDSSAGRLSKAELDEIAELIEQARKEGR